VRRVAALLLAAASCFAGTPVISQGKLDNWVARWRHVLQLDDWDIKAKTVRLADLPEGDAAFSETVVQLQMLRIYVLDPRDYAAMAKRDGEAPKTSRAILRDIEDSVIHEMVHLRVRPFKLASIAQMDAAEELLVDRLTTALLKARKR